MDIDLKAELGRRNLLPYECDEELQMTLASMGIPSESFETLYSPETPETIITLIDRIENNVRELFQMEQGYGSNTEYNHRELQIWNDLVRLDCATAHSSNREVHARSNNEDYMPRHIRPPLLHK